MVTVEDFSTWYENHKDSAPQHEAKLDPLNTEFPIANNCMCMILGATGSGKSHVLKDIFDRTYYDVIFFISPTGSFDQTADERPVICQYQLNYTEPEEGIAKVYEYLMRRLLLDNCVTKHEQLMERKLSGGIVSDYDFQKILEEMDEITNGLPYELFNMDHRVAVVLDDCGYKSNALKNKESEFTKLTMIRRHLGVSIFACLQSYIQIEKDIRRQASDILMTKATPNEDIKSLYHQLSRLPAKDIISQPRFFTALVEGLTKNNNFGTVQFLYGGLYHDFKKVGREQMVNVIREYEQLRRDMRKKIG